MMKILDNKRNYYNHKFMALFILLQKKKKQIYYQQTVGK